MFYNIINKWKTMTHYTSPSTGNTIYKSSCGLFSCLSLEDDKIAIALVTKFEESGITSKYDFTRGSAHRWMFAGSCPIAEEYTNDMSTASVLKRDAEIDYRKSSKYGKNCNPFRQKEAGDLARDTYLKNKGYDVNAWKK